MVDRLEVAEGGRTWASEAMGSSFMNGGFHCFSESVFVRWIGRGNRVMGELSGQEPSLILEAVFDGGGWMADGAYIIITAVQLTAWAGSVCVIITPISLDV